MDGEAQKWLDSWSTVLVTQQAVLRALTDAVEHDARWRWLELGGSLARGAGDVDSDLDLGLGVSEDAWPHALMSVPALVETAGTIVDASHHRITEWGDVPHQRTFVQYSTGVQLDLVVLPATRRRGHPPNSVVLYDADGCLTAPWVPAAFTADAVSVREWAFQGWIALADMAKYLRRGSLWEAYERLHQGRTYVWRLWAAAQALSYPVFGLTSLLDSPAAILPPNIAATVSSLDHADLHRAGLACASLLDQVAQRAASQVGADLPVSLASFVRARLEE